MTDDEARTLATRMIDTWPSGPKAYIWRNEFTHLDAPPAYTAFGKMRAECERATIAAFHVRYQAAASQLAPPIPLGNPQPHPDDVIGIDEAIARIAHYDPQAAANLAAFRSAFT